MIIYECSNVLENKTCAHYHTHLDILSRVIQPMTTGIEHISLHCLKNSVFNLITYNLLGIVAVNY